MSRSGKVYGWRFLNNKLVALNLNKDASKLTKDHDKYLQYVLDKARRVTGTPSLSIGVAEHMVDSEDLFGLLDIAESRAYLAKEQGTNQIVKS